jgi:hypothetical protein
MGVAVENGSDSKPVDRLFEPRRAEEGKTSGDSPSQVWPLDARCKVTVAELEFWTADIPPAANS